MVTGLHHVQLAMPAGREAEARAFYAGVLGLAEVEKPATLRLRGGLWFERGQVRVHLGIEDPFLPARKAHPAFEVGALRETIATLESAGIDFMRDDDLPGHRRVFVADPFGNRIELLEAR